MNNESEHNAQQPTKALTKTDHEQASSQQDKLSAEEKALLLKLKLSRAHLLSVFAVLFTALAVLGGGLLWAQINGLQKIVYTSGGIKDVDQLHRQLQQSQGKLTALQARVDDMGGLSAELGRIGNVLSGLNGQLTQLRRSTVETMAATQTHTQNLVTDKLGGFSKQISTTGTELAKMQGVIQELRDQFSSRLKLLEIEQSQYQSKANASLAALEKTVNRSQTERVLSEVEHYLKVAKQRISVDKAVRAAEIALLAALERLQELDSQQIQAIETVLQQDIAKLKAIKQYDLAGLDQHLVELQAIIEDLPLKGMDKRFIVEEFAVQDGPAGVWDKAWSTVKNGLSQVVHIRRMNEPVMPLIAPEQSYFLYQNLHLELQAARLALLQREQTVYAQSLQSTRTWTEKYLAPSAHLKSLQDTLRHLAKVNINPTLPALNKTLQLLREQRRITVSSKAAASL